MSKKPDPKAAKEKQKYDAKKKAYAKLGLESPKALEQKMFNNVLDSMSSFEPAKDIVELLKKSVEEGVVHAEVRKKQIPYSANRVILESIEAASMRVFPQDSKRGDDKEIQNHIEKIDEEPMPAEFDGIYRDKTNLINKEMSLRVNEKKRFELEAARRKNKR